MPHATATALADLKQLSRDAAALPYAQEVRKALEELRNSFSVRDIIGGLSVAVVVIPQSLAYAEIAGLPPAMGLAAAALPALAAAPFASSRYLQTGPVAMTALLTFGALTTLAEPGTDDYIELALLLALVVGVTRIALGIANAGPITNYMSPPVILGFTTSAAILIGASQITSVMGVEDVPADIRERLWTVVLHPGQWNWQAVGLSILVAALIIGGRKIHASFPGILLAALVGLWIGSRTGYSAPLVGSLPEGFSPLSLSMPWGRLPDLLLPGFVIATIGFAEATAISRTFAIHDSERWDASRELISQGLANIAAGISGGFPVGGSFSRSSISRLAGTQTRWAGAVTGILVLAFIPVAGIMSHLPRAVLGAIVIFAIYHLVRIDEIIRMLRISRGQASIAIFTAVVTLVLAPRVDLAVLLGMAVATGVHLFRESSRLKIPATHAGGRLTLQPDGVLFYGSAGSLYETLDDELNKHGGCSIVVLDLGRLGRIDYTGFKALQSFAEIVRSSELELEIVNIPSHAEGLFGRAGGL